MSRWKEELDNHPIHGTVQEIRALLKEADSRRSSRATLVLKRLRRSINALWTALGEVDPEYVSPNWIWKLNDILLGSHVKGHIVEYNNFGDVHFLVMANNHIEKKLNEIRQLPPLLGLNNGQKYHSENVFHSAEGNMTEVPYDETQSVTDAWNKERQIISELDKLGNAAKARKESYDKLLKKHYNEHVREQKARDDEYAKLRETQIKEVVENAQKAISDAGEILTEKQDEFETKLKSYSETAEEQKNKIQELYEISAGDSEAAGYMKNASEEQSKARVWQRAFYFAIVFSVIWITAMVGGPYFTPPDQSTVDQGSQWVELLKTFSVTGFLGFGIIYAANQANSHRRAEEYNRNKAIDVKALDPFISSLPEEDKNEMKKLATIVFFLSREASDRRYKKNTPAKNDEGIMGNLSKNYLAKYTSQSKHVDDG